MKIGPKILTLCLGGNSRSVACAYFLKDKGYEALSAGMNHVSATTLAMLFQWADTVIVTTKEVKLPPNLKAHPKVLLWDVGLDRWFHGYDVELLAKLLSYYQDTVS